MLRKGAEKKSLVILKMELMKEANKRENELMRFSRKFERDSMEIENTLKRIKL
ncbi:TPA: hypothetical protein QCX07_003006 [Bacillus cytotoxicus]|uniref:hypothetical protein n=1 Tax=Bacillus cytotoxicus TaxID=580165 RepID=UPI0013A59FE1|nr:hypothetical protein [Bacillus cytotoxicus]HDR7296214.1 hypothetical protein [Bacillus cytotoxicus]HDR7881703.1 hypothetical protein [Bacillus cytotoxicus]